tara:strand:+ start:243 stop:524 length:282 start_codon:yes stop_codon:yes gene_type:complete
MNIKAISFKDFLKNKNDIYKNINVVAKRARQIIDGRYEKVLALQNIEDTEELEQIIDEDFDKQKSISKAMEEFLNDDLESKSHADLDTLSDNE